jgi:hypothetical protein
MSALAKHAEESLSLIPSLATLTATLATPQSAAVIAVRAIALGRRNAMSANLLAPLYPA